MNAVKKLKRGSDICDQLASQRLACSPSVSEFLASQHGSSLRRRVEVVAGGGEPRAGGTVLYWMCRDRRVQVSIPIHSTHRVAKSQQHQQRRSRNILIFSGTF